MNVFRSTTVLCSAIVAVGFLSGCERVKHELHPNQLWRLNRGPKAGILDSSFSISDDEATARSGELRAKTQQELNLPTDQELWLNSEEK